MLYLSVEEPTGYIAVTCDGYVFRLDSDNTSARAGYIYFGTGTTQAVNLQNRLASANTPNIASCAIVQEVPSMIVLVQRGSYNSVAGSSYTLTAYCYSGMVILNLSISLTSTTTLSSNPVSGSRLFFLEGESGITGDTAIYEDTTEKTASINTQYNTADYVGFTSTQGNIILINTYSSVTGSATVAQGIYNASDRPYINCAGDLDAGTTEIGAAYIIDATDRIGGKQYVAGDRLTLGNQHHDIAANANLPDIADSLGSLVTDLNIPKTFVSEDKPPSTNSVLNTAHPLANGLVGAWVMNEGSGTTVNDRSGNGHHATVASGLWHTDGLTFNGTTDSGAGVPDNVAFKSLTSFTVFVKLVYHGGEAWGMVLSGPNIQLYKYDTTGNIGCYIRDVRSDYNSGVAFDVDSEQTVALVYDGSNIYFYKNGAEVHRVADTGTTGSSANTITLGSGGSGGYSLENELHTVSFYNRALTAQEISQLHADPYQMFSKGFASDGAYHLEPDATTKDTKLVFNQTEINPVVVLEDASVRTGAGTEHLKGHWKCDDNATNSTVVATVGADANWKDRATQSARNTNNDSVPGIRGGALATSDLYFMDMPCGSGTIHNNAFLKRGSIHIKFTPDRTTYSSANDRLFYLASSGGYNNFVRLGYNAQEQWGMDIRYGHGTTKSITTVGMTPREFERPTDIICWWDYDANVVGMSINGTIYTTTIDSSDPTTNEPAVFTIGCEFDHGAPFDISIDEIKTYNAPILPYGTLIPGNSDYSAGAYNSDISFHWDCTNQSTTPEIGTGTISLNHGITQTSDGLVLDHDQKSASITFTSEDNVSCQEGSVLLAVTLGAGYALTENILRIQDDASNLFLISIGYSGDDRIQIQHSVGGALNTAQSGAGILAVGGRYIIYARWKVGQVLQLYVNGVLVAQDTTLSGTFTGDGSGTITFGNSSPGSYSSVEGTYEFFTITNNINTPQLPFVLGHGPRNIPLLRRVR